MLKYYIEFLDENKNFDNGFYNICEYRDKFFNPCLKILKIKEVRWF